MKPFVITISDIEDSVKSAQRCIDSAKEFGIDVEIFEAYTPKDKPFDVLVYYHTILYGKWQEL